MLDFFYIIDYNNKAFENNCAEVVEWQTRRTQNPLVVIPCGFKSHLRHQTKIKRTLINFQSSFYFLQEIIQLNC